MVLYIASSIYIYIHVCIDYIHICICIYMNLYICGGDHLEHLDLMEVIPMGIMNTRSVAATMTSPSSRSKSCG